MVFQKTSLVVQKSMKIVKLATYRITIWSLTRVECLQSASNSVADF